MKTLVIFESAYGNTEEIARSIGGAITGDVKVLRANEVGPSDLESIDLLIVGSPTQAGRPLSAVQDFLKNIAESVIKDTKVATFDTRFSTRAVKVFGYAAGRIADSLKKKGGNLIAPPEPFFVKGMTGPLKEGEPQRAAGWAREITR